MPQSLEQELINASQAYGRALEQLEKARMYMRETAPHMLTNGCKITVSWDYGSACTGYDELRVLVSGFVANSMKTNLEAAVQLLHKQARQSGEYLDKLRKDYLKEL